MGHAFIMASVLLEAPVSDGGVSPLAWTIISALATAIVSVCLFAKYWTDRLYSDLKECNEKRAASEEDVLGVLKVLRLQMEQSKGGKQR